MTELILDRVRLVPATVELLHVEDLSAAMLAAALGITAPPSWPPEFNGPETRAWVRKHLEDDAANARWLSWYIIKQDETAATLAGIAGYKGPPDEQGEVEIGYAVIPELQRQGLATSAVRALRDHALQQGVRSIIAHTIPSLIASQGVLTKAGFIKTQVVSDPDAGELWKYQLRGL